MSPRESTRDAEKEVRRIYAEWEQRPLERHCTGIARCCHFRLNGRTPYLTRGEAIVAARAWRAAGRREVAPAPDGCCPFLRDERCQIYDGRPFGCRTHFCEAAGGPARRREVRDLIRRLEEVDRQLGGSGPVNFVAAVTEAMKSFRR